MIAILYMWSAIDSPSVIPLLTHPVLFCFYCDDKLDLKSPYKNRYLEIPDNPHELQQIGNYVPLFAYINHHQRLPGSLAYFEDDNSLRFSPDNFRCACGLFRA